MTPIVIKVSGEQVPFEFKGDTPELKELQDAVGGYITLVEVDAETCLVANDEGWIKGMDINERASKILVQGGGVFHTVVGDVIHISKDLID